MRIVVSLLSAAVVALSPTAGGTAPASCESGLTVSFGKRSEAVGTTDLSGRARDNDKFDTPFAGADDARWVRFRFGIRPKPQDPPFSLAVTDGKGRILESYGPEDLLEPYAFPGETALPTDDGEGEKTIWTGRIAPPPDGINFDLWPVQTEGSIKYRELIAMRLPPSGAVYYSAADPDDPRWASVDASGGEEAMRLARSVALVMPSYRQDVRGCSGFALDRDVLMTNWHCGWVEGLDDRDAWNDSICKATLVDFSFDLDQTSGEYRCDRILTKNKPLDYVLMRIVPVDRAHRVLPLPVSQQVIADGDGLSVLHHPTGMRKQITKGCVVLESELAGWIDPALTRLAHDCDTAPGSSGAPVFDAEMRVVVGLHHRGYERDPVTCKTKEAVPHNKAIAMHAILADIESKREEIKQRLGHALQMNVK